MYKPLELIQYIANKYPGCWNQIEEIRGDEEIMIYHAASITNMLGKKDLMSMINNAQDAVLMTVLAKWRKDKKVYSFTDSLSDILFEYADIAELKMPVEILERIEDKAFFVESSLNNLGFFVHMDFDVRKGYKELCIIEIKQDINIPYYIYMIPDKTLSECLYEVIKVDMNQLAGDPYNNKIIDYYINESPLLKMVQLILYLCAENADIITDYTNYSVSDFTFIKDKYRELKKSKVGTNVVYNHQKKHGQGSKKAMHVRQAHWHHFWAGSDKDSSKHLILKWLPPTLIGNEDVDVIDAE